MKSPNEPQPDDGDSNDGDDDGADQHIWRAPTYSSLMVMMVMMVMMIVREPMARQISTNIPQPDDGDGDYDGDGEGANKRQASINAPQVVMVVKFSFKISVVTNKWKNA